MSLNHNLSADAFPVNPLGWVAEDRFLQLRKRARDDHGEPDAKSAAPSIDKRPCLMFDIGPFARWREPYSMFDTDPLTLPCDTATPAATCLVSTMCSDE